MNVAAIGNVVPMLHIHIVARSPGDIHWPQPIWGQGKAEPLTKIEEAWRRLSVVTCSRLLRMKRHDHGRPAEEAEITA